MDLRDLNIRLRSSFEVDDLVFLLDVDIAKIKSTLDYNEEYYKISFPTEDKDKISYISDTRENPYRHWIGHTKMKRAIGKISAFVDIETECYGGKNILDDLGFSSRKQLTNFFSEILTMDDAIRIIQEIDFYISKVKLKFSKVAMELLELDKQYPSITLKNKLDLSKEQKGCMTYTYAMMSLQPSMELSSTIIFPENINRAYMDWSWREQEIKRLYLTSKTRKDNYTERVHAKKHEEMMSKKK